MIKVIAFDLDDTLWAVGPIIINAENRLNDWLFQHVPRIKYDVVGMRALRHELLGEEPDLINKITEFRRRIIMRALQHSDIDDARASELSHQAMAVFLEARNEIVFFEGAMDAIIELSSEFTLGALTNGNANIVQLGLDRYFSFAFSAEEVGAPKPAHNLFDKALAHTGTEPHQMVYVGDDPVLDVDSANNRGLHTILVRNPAKDKPGTTTADENVDHIKHLPKAVERLLAKLY
jgi:HAD superfamily hydrolase (TIGR01549 family)